MVKDIKGEKIKWTMMLFEHLQKIKLNVFVSFIIKSNLTLQEIWQLNITKRNPKFTPNRQLNRNHLSPLWGVSYQMLAKIYWKRNSKPETLRSCCLLHKPCSSNIPLINVFCVISWRGPSSSSERPLWWAKLTGKRTGRDFGSALSGDHQTHTDSRPSGENRTYLLFGQFQQ